MKRVFVVGSLNMDIVVRTHKIPRSGETILSEDFFTNCGGKGANQAVASAKQGAETFHMGAIGNDSFGAQLIDSLTSYGVDCTFVKQKEKSTGVAMVILHNGDNRIIVSPGANYEYSIEEAKSDLAANAKPGDILVLQLEIQLEVVLSLILFAKQLGLFVIFNPAPMIMNFPKKYLASVDILIMNEWETKMLVKNELSKFTTRRAVAKLAEFGAKTIIITLGESGGVYYENGILSKYDAFLADVIDTTGAGDAFVGTIAAMLAANAPLTQAVMKASYVAAITVSRQGAQQAIPTKAELEDAIIIKKEK